MQVPGILSRFAQPFVQQSRTGVRRMRTYLGLVQHSTATVLPQIIQPDPQEIYVTLTADCNLRCQGCRYGREFMHGHQLPWATVRDLLDDCKKLGIRNIRLYGGEPLLHRDIVRIVEHSASLGLHTWLTTNGILLKRKADDLYRAGLRRISVGFYGTDEGYNAYVQRKDQYPRLVEGVAYVRERFGMDVAMTLGWVLMRPNCSVDELHKVWAFAERYQTPIGVSLVHYSLPYFTEGPERELQFRPEDRPAIELVVDELLRLKQSRPELIQQSAMSLRSIVDWTLKGPQMEVPCDRYKLIWIGADGTVQMCYVTFKLGNLHENRLADLLFTPAHHQAAKDAFGLKCPRCHCSYHTRIERHLPSRLHYSKPLPSEHPTAA